MGEGLWFSARSLAAVAGPAYGGGVYEVGGFTLPYTLIGGLILVLALVLRSQLGPERVGVAKNGNGGLLKMLQFRSTVASAISIASVSAVYFATDVLYQPWLGAAPFKYMPSQISTVQITQVLSQVVVAGVVGSVYTSVRTKVASPCQCPQCPCPCRRATHLMVTQVISVMFGGTLVAAAFSLIGVPPNFFPGMKAFPSQPYIVAVMMGCGSGITGPTMFALSVELLIKYHGYTHEEAAPMGTIQVLCGLVGNFMGPVILGITEQVSVADGASAMFAIALFLVVVQFALLVPYAFTDPPLNESTPLMRNK